MSDNTIIEALDYIKNKKIKINSKDSKKNNVTSNNLLFIYDMNTDKIIWGWMISDLHNNYKSRMLLNYLTSKEVKTTEDMYIKYLMLRATSIPKEFVNIVLALGVYFIKADYYTFDIEGNKNHIICSTFNNA